jgi:oxygen-independent coproporphyrinogen-3 oxidase
LAELSHQLKQLYRSPIQINSVYFGGGTPSLAQPQLVENILKAVQDLGLSKDTEVTLEANPGVRLSSVLAIFYAYRASV